MNGRMQREHLFDVIKQMQDSINNGGRATFKKDPFGPIITAFNYAKDNDIKVLLETSELTNPSVVIVSLDFVGPRFCRGTATYEQSDGYEIRKTNVPYTINYADVYQSMSKKGSATRIVFEGENPFWEDYKEETNV